MAAASAAWRVAKAFQPLPRCEAAPLQPALRRLRPPIGRQEFVPLHPGGLGQTEQAPLGRRQALVEAPRLLDQFDDPVGVQAKAADQPGHRVACFGIGRRHFGREGPALGMGQHAPGLELAEPFLGGPDGLERRDHLRADLFLAGAQRDAGNAFAILLGHLLIGRLVGYILVCGIGPQGRIEVDEVPQQQLSGVEIRMPAQEGIRGRRQLAQAADHHLAPGLDPFGDRDLALARQQAAGAHFAEVQLHRVVGAPVVAAQVAATLLVFGRIGRGRRWRGLILILGRLDDLDPEPGEGGHGVLDQVRGCLFQRQDRRQLGLRDMAALPGAGHELPQCRRIRSRQRRVQGFLAFIHSDFDQFRHL